MKDLCLRYAIKRILSSWVVPEVLPRLSTKAHADIVTLGALSRSGLQRAFIGDSDSRNRQFNPVRKLLPFPRDSLAEQPCAVHELVAARLLFS